MSKYDRWNPDKIHMVRGHPIIYTKTDKPITQWDAERQFEKAINTMHTWASRAFKLAMAGTDHELRDYNLEHLEWKLDNIAVWLGSMREAMDEARGKQRKQDTILALRAKADSTEFPGEAVLFRAKAAELEAKQDGGAA